MYLGTDTTSPLGRAPAGNDSPRSRLPRTRRFALLWVFVLLSALLGTATPANAASVSPGTLGGFEQDGNFVVDAAPNIDWTAVTPTRVTDDTRDSGFQGSSKEEDPTNWTCNTGGADPGKGNILRAYVNPRIGIASGANYAYLDLGFVRAEGNGDAHVNFEFNQQPTAAGSCSINRNVGDFLVTYDFAGGSSPANIRAWRWDGSHWVEMTLQASDAAAASNTNALTDPLDGNSAVVARGFGEVTLNLLAAGLPSNLVGCPGFGTVNVRSRSSESIHSALQDKLPATAVNLSTCAKVVIHKTDNHQPPRPLADAVFGLYASVDGTGTPVATCTSVANGSCTFDRVTPGTYSIKEISAPAGYSPDPAVRTVTVGFRETKDLTAPFVDPRDTGFVRVLKQLRDGQGNVVTPPDLSVLDGTTFVVYRDTNPNDGVFQTVEAARVWPAETTIAECTIAGGTAACSTGPLPTGSYRVHETVAPPGVPAGPDVNVTVSAGTQTTATTVTYVNTLPPLNLQLVKSGPDFAAVGTTFTYTFAATTTGPRLHAVSLVELAPDRCTTPLAGPTGDDGDLFLEVGETWRWTCTHTVTAGDPHPLLNTARVSGTDDYGRTVTTTDNHSVDTVLPGINVVKSGPATAHVGDTITYGFAVTNPGAAAIVLRDVGVTDPRCATTPMRTGGDTNADNLLQAGETWTYTCTHLVVAADPDPLPNTATASGTDPEDVVVTDTDDHTVDLVHPAITVVKSGPGTAHVRDTVTYAFTVTNAGDTVLHNVTVADPRCDTTPVRTGGDTNADNLLQASETWIFSCTHVVTAGDPDPLPNTATASGTDPDNVVVTDTGDHTVDLIHPGIVIDKSGPATANVGGTVTYDFAVTNSGDVALHDVALSDARCDTGTVTGPDGDTNADGVLQTTETWTFSCTHVVTAGDPDPLPNTATASGTDPLDRVVTDTDGHSVDVVHPGITVVKSGPATAHEGESVTYSFVVTNTGDTALSGVVVTDNVLGPIGTIADLAVGASVTLTKAYTVPTPSSGVDNQARACGDDPSGTEVCDTDDHHLTVTAVLGASIERPQAPGTEVARGVLARTGGSPIRTFAGMAALLAVLVFAFARRRSTD